MIVFELQLSEDHALGERDAKGRPTCSTVAPIAVSEGRVGQLYPIVEQPVVFIETLVRTEDGSFVGLDEATGMRGGRAHGRNYVEGCLVLRAEGKRLLGAAEWTDVDWLWSFLLDGVDALAARRSFETAFPDMPLSVAFQIVERHGHRDLVTILVDGSGGRSASVSRLELLDALVAAGLEFFEHLGKLVPARAGTSHIARARLAKHERVEASSRIQHAGGDLRVANGVCEALLDYLVAHVVEINPELGERILRAVEGPGFQHWRIERGARVKLDELAHLVGGGEPLRRLLELHEPSLEQVAEDDSSKRQLVRTLTELHRTLQ